MALKVLIAPDKFKGTLTAPAAAAAIACGWQKARPHDRLDLLPISDGGDGFGEAMSRLLGAKAQTLKTVDAAHRPCVSKWWWAAKTQTAIIESANIIGLAQLPFRQFHPFQLDTFGLGAALQAAARRGVKRCYLGIGGSATNDGGFGVARALGWKFLAASGQPILEWTQLTELTSLQPPRRVKIFPELIVAVDVQNPLLGPRGCARIYGPQKGLAAADFPLAERALGQLASQVRRQLKLAVAVEPGAGAAGGLGFGLRSFAGAKLRSGFDLFARQAKLTARLARADLVITGEGSIDESTLMGKGVGQLAARCFQAKIPCLGLGGVVAKPRNQKTNYFLQLHGLTHLTTADEAKSNAAHWLEKLGERAAMNLNLE